MCWRGGHGVAENRGVVRRSLRPRLIMLVTRNSQEPSSLSQAVTRSSSHYSASIEDQGKRADSIRVNYPEKRVDYHIGCWTDLLQKSLQARIRSLGVARALSFLLLELFSNLRIVLIQQFREREVMINGVAIRFMGLSQLLFGGEKSIPILQRWANVLSKSGGERAVEIPFALWFYSSHPHERVLEVGNVLSYYSRLQSRDIIDKYETIPGLINEDLLVFQTKNRYDLIISISTIEHIGWDEMDHDPSKSLQAIHKLLALLDPRASLLVSVPVGYNPSVDDFVLRDSEWSSSIILVGRNSRSGVWKQISAREIGNADSCVAFLVVEGSEAKRSS